MKNKSNKSALVVEGGGMRGIFAAGVLNAFGSEGFDPFDLYIGVSAGACNLASHLAGQNNRNYNVITDYSSTPNFINFRRFLFGGHLMDLDWLWNITISQCRLDLKRIFETIRKQEKEFLVVATSIDTGKPMYLKPDENTLEHYLKVSSSVPVLYRNILEINSEKATDGGVADSIPVMEAFRRGATDITVIRSRHNGYVKKGSDIPLLYHAIFRKYPQFVHALKLRSAVYMESAAFIKNPPAGVRIREIAPPHDLKVGRVTRDLKALNKAYRLGIIYGKKHIETEMR
jgi:predicted patatin/cPLA2 family phospholipase